MVGQRILCRNARERDQHGSDSTLQDTGHGAYEEGASAVLVNSNFVKTEMRFGS